MNIWASLWSTKLIYVVDCRKRGGRWNIIMKEIEASWWQLVTINQLKYNVSFWMSLLKNIACICKVSWSVCCACDRCEKIGDDLVSKMAMSVSITCRGGNSVKLIVTVILFCLIAFSDPPTLSYIARYFVKWHWMSYPCLLKPTIQYQSLFCQQIFNYGMIWTKYQRLSRILLHIINFRSFAPTSFNVYCKRVSWCHC